MAIQRRTGAPQTATLCGVLLTNYLQSELDLQKDVDFKLVPHTTEKHGDEYVLGRTVVVNRSAWTSLNMSARKFRNRLKKMMGDQLVSLDVVDSRAVLSGIRHVVAFKVNWLR